MGIKVIVTGATGMVGEGVMLTCIDNPLISAILLVTRRPSGVNHPKVTEVIVPDFFHLESYAEQLKGYDACFFCAGVTSIGKTEESYYDLTYHPAISFAKIVAKLNAGMVFTYVSGQYTDSTEKGKVMWARIKGKTENDLMRLPFKNVFCFRPGMMKAIPGQKRLLKIYPYFAWLYPIIKALKPNSACTLEEVGTAMIHAATKGYPKNILEVGDIMVLARS